MDFQSTVSVACDGPRRDASRTRPIRLQPYKYRSSYAFSCRSSKARYSSEDHVVAEAGEGVSHSVSVLFDLIARRKAIKRRDARQFQRPNPWTGSPWLPSSTATRCPRFGHPKCPISSVPIPNRDCIAGFQTRRAPEPGDSLPTWKSATQQAWKPALPVHRRSRPGNSYHCLSTSSFFEKSFGCGFAALRNIRAKGSQRGKSAGNSSNTRSL